MSVRIGMIAYASCKDVGRVVAPVDYIRAVERTGASVLVAPPGPSAVALLDVVQGLVLVGGGDIDPTRYGAERHAKVYGVDAERDACEISVIEAALAKRLPILAICRGMQLLNVVLGGTLHQHVPDVVGDALAHRVTRDPDIASCEHVVRIDSTASLAEICGAPSINIASFHHQAVDKLGRGVVPCAWAEDGIIEAIAIEDHPEVIAVQWHPELTAVTDSRQQAIFGWLTQRARTGQPGLGAL